MYYAKTMYGDLTGFCEFLYFTEEYIRTSKNKVYPIFSFVCTISQNQLVLQASATMNSTQSVIRSNCDDEKTKN